MKRNAKMLKEDFFQSEESILVDVFRLLEKIRLLEYHHEKE